MDSVDTSAWWFAPLVGVCDASNNDNAVRCAQHRSRDVAKCDWNVSQELPRIGHRFVDFKKTLVGAAFIFMQLSTHDVQFAIVGCGSNVVTRFRDVAELAPAGINVGQINGIMGIHIVELELGTRSVNVRSSNNVQNPINHTSTHTPASIGYVW